MQKTPAAKSKMRAGPTIAILVLLSAIGPFTMNVVMPMTPALADAFETDYATAQLTLTVYLLATAVSTVLLGALADRHGRRPVVLGGLALYVVGTLIAAVAPDITTLIAARAVQAVGGTSGLILSRTMLYDTYGRDRAASLIGYVTMAMVLAPMLAPVIGGYAVEHAGWRHVFAGMAVVGAALLVLSIVRVGETRPPELRTGNAFSRASVFRLLGSRAFWGVTANLSFSSGIFFAFVGAAPYVVIKILKLPASSYGIWFIVVSLGYMLGNFLSGRLSQRMGAERMIVVGSIVAFVGIGALWLMAPIASPAAIFFPMAMIAVSNGLTLPNATASAMAVAPDLSGTASGLAGAIQIGVGAVMTMLVALWLDDSALPMRVLMTGCAILSLVGIVVSLGPRKIQRLLSVRPAGENA